MALSRRDALRGLLLGATVPLVSTACRSKQKQEESVTASRKPRKLVVIFLSGGPDGVLTMDPKTPAEVEPWVDNPLFRDNVGTGNVRLGGLWAPLERWSKQMAVVHGVQVESANHFSGTWQLLRLRRRAVLSTPTIPDLIARHRESPLGAIVVGSMFNRTYSPSWLPLDGSVVGTGGTQGLAKFDDVPAGELRELAAAMREHANRPTLSYPDREAYRRVIAYIDGLLRVGKFKPEDWKIRGLRDAVIGLQRVVWALEHDFTSAALVYFGLNKFDSHWQNLERQRGVNGIFVPAFDRFLAELGARRNAHGTLAEQTTIIVAGEVGRLPRINSDGGKDHLPEISLMLMGAGVATKASGNVVGATGRDMMGKPIDLATGAIGGSRHIMLDDVGGTVLRMFDIEPTQYGYPSRPIEPLIA